MNATGNNYVLDFNPGTDYFENLGQSISRGTRQTKMDQLGARQCNTAPPLCPFEVQWAGQWKGVPSFTMSREVPMYERDERAWQTDLNSMQFDYGIEMARHWNPYDFMDGRQMFMQFSGAGATTELSFGRDRYMRQVHSLGTSKMVQPVYTPCARW